MYPILRIGTVTVPAFGVMLATGFVVVHIVLAIQARHFRYPFERLHVLMLVAFSGGTIGARFLHMVLNGEPFTLSEAISVSHGTLYYGFFLGASISTFLYYAITRRATSAWRELDYSTPAWLSLQFFGRIGCFLAGCCYGTPTKLPWGVTFHSPLSDAPNGIPLHPTQLYEAAVVLLLFVYAYRAQSSVTHSAYRIEGSIFLRVVALYGIARFFLEFVRGDSRGTIFGVLSTSQEIVLIIIPVVLAVWFVRYFHLKSFFFAFKGESI